MPADSLPMRPFPEEAIAAAADEIVVEPWEGLGRNSIANRLFCNTGQLAAAGHAARGAQRQFEAFGNELGLTLLVERHRHKQRRDKSLDRRAVRHQAAVVR